MATLASAACDIVSPIVPGEVVSSNGTLSILVPDTVHTIGLYVDVQVRGWNATPPSTHCFRQIRSPSYSLDGAPPVDPTSAAPCDVIQTSESTWTLFVSQYLAPGTHTLDVSANGAHAFKTFQVVRDSSRYALSALPTLGGRTGGSDINQGGVVAGWAADAGGIRHAVTWSGGVLQRLPDSDSSRATGLNDVGGVVGLMQDARLTRACLRGVIWQNGGAPKLLSAYPSTATPDTSFVCAKDAGFCYENLDCAAESHAPVDVNNNATVLTRGYLAVGGTVRGHAYGLPIGWALNNRDQAVFTLGDALSYGYHDSLEGLNITLKQDYMFGRECPRYYTDVAGLNDHSVTVGNASGHDYYGTGCGERAFEVDSAGQATDLSRTTGDLHAVALNNLGDIILAGHGNIFVLKQGRLAVIAVSEPGWTNIGVIKINDAGTILGAATDPNGITRVVLLTPVR